MKAELARTAGNYEGAARALDEVITKYPDLEEAYAVACRLNQPVIGALPNPQKHIAVLEAGLAAVPSSTLLRNHYGYALLHTGKYAEAIRAFESYAAIAPREPNPHDSLGEAHLLMGSPDKALVHFSRALTIDPRFFPSHVGRVWAFGMLGRYDEALAEAPVSGFIRAFVLSRVGRYREAEQLMAGDIRQAEANKNVFDEGMLRLLSLVVAVERNPPPPAIDDLVTAGRRFAAEHRDGRAQVASVLAHTIAGLTDLRAGRNDNARALLEAQRRIVNQEVHPEYWWHKLLEGEIALAEGDFQKAAAAFSAGEPDGKMWLHLTVTHLSLLANNLLSRDGAARVARSRGDLQGAIDVYRRLLAVGPNQKWTAMFEPRYVLEIARLQEKRGDGKAVLAEYRRFLEFWKQADADAPELAEARRAIARLR